MPSGTGLAASQGAPAPPAPETYNAAAYQMPQGPTLTQTGAVNPALMAGGTDEQALAASKAAQAPGPQITDPSDFNANIHPYSKADLSKMTKDPDLGNYAGFQWRQDKKIGTVYAVQKSPEPFHELRWNAGRDQWDNYWMENGQLMKQVQDARANTPMENVVSDTDLENMSAEDLKQALDDAVRWHATGGSDPSSATSFHIRGGIEQYKSLTRLIDMIQAAKNANVDPREYNKGQTELSKEAAESGAMEPPSSELFYPQTGPNAAKGLFGVPYINPGGAWHEIQSAWHRAFAGGSGQVHPLADDLLKEANYLTTTMQQTPGIKYTAEGKPEAETPIEAHLWQGGPAVKIQTPGDISPLQEVNRIFSNQKPEDVIAGLKTVRDRIGQEIRDSTDIATRMNYRTPPEFRNAVEAIKNGKNIEDKTNLYRDEHGNLKAPPGRLPSASPTPMATVNSQADLDAFKKKYPPGTHYMAPNENGKMVEWVSQ